LTKVECLPEFKCPVCDGTVQVPEDALDGELFEHAECGAQLELVTSEGRRILRLAEEVGEDWGE
jgi:alpha-aminoadipate carrier protein LysW